MNKDPRPITANRRVALAALPLVLASCGSAAGMGWAAKPAVQVTPEPRELTVLAAASLADAFGEIAGDFPRQPGRQGTRVTCGFGASSLLRAQLEQGAPADLFASADDIQMEQAIKAGVIQGVPRVFTRNRLVLIVPRENRASVNALGDLAKPGVKFVTAPKEVPVGQYTRRVLGNMAADPQFGSGFDQKVLANVVSQESNVRQVVTKVQLGEADASIVYASDVTAKVAPDVKVIEIPERHTLLAEYPVAVVKHARAPILAAQFVEFLRGDMGQATLRRHGFMPVG
jgi:molybdate transport system substrate-binding protein